MSAKSPKAQKPREVRWNDIQEQLLKDKIEFFLNTHLEPTVLIPDDGFQTEWLVDSQRFQDLLIATYFEISNGGMLKSNERDFLLAQIREECREGGRRLTEPETEETDKDVIVQAVVALMNRDERFSDQTMALVKKLKEIQTEEKISTDEIPIFTNIFSKKLNRLIPVLRGYGVEVVMEHKESGSHCTLKRLVTFKKEPSIEEVVTEGSAGKSSSQSSVTTPKTGTGLPSADGADGEFRGDPRKSSIGPTESKAGTSAKNGGVK